jgi:hypothetical protein
MVKRTRLPKVVLGRKMLGSAPTEKLKVELTTSVNASTEELKAELTRSGDVFRAELTQLARGVTQLIMYVGRAGSVLPCNPKI